MNFFPKEPVPPVTTTDRPSKQFAAIWAVSRAPMYGRVAERLDSVKGL